MRAKEVNVDLISGIKFRTKTMRKYDPVKYTFPDHAVWLVLYACAQPYGLGNGSFFLIRVIKFRVFQGIVGDHKISLNTPNFLRNPLTNPCQLKNL